MDTEASSARRLRRAGSDAWKLAGTLAALLVLSACGSDGDGSPAGPTLTIQTGAAPVGGATCTLTGAAGKTLAANATTSSSGAASFSDVAAAPGLTLVSCTGGSYTDLASGRTLAAPRLRAYVASPGPAGGSAQITPFTELAVRLLSNQNADAQYVTARDRVARAFGLEGIDIGKVGALDLSNNNASDDAASRHGMALAALSQLETEAASARRPTRC